MARLPSIALLLTGLTCSAHAAIGSDGWYLSLGGGISRGSNNMSVIANSQVNGIPMPAQVTGMNYKNGWNGDGTIGYKSGPIRYEGEFLYINDKPRHFEVNGVQTLSAGGSSRNLAGLLNIYYDFDDTGMSITPFIGAGAGWLNTRVQPNGTILQGAFAVPFSTSLTANYLGYHVSAGLMFNINNNAAVSLAYRYLASTSAHTLGKHVQEQLGTLAFIYRFDQT